MEDVYESCPVIEGLRYLLRQVSPDDCSDLLQVYSDPKAAAFFNSDNCHGDNFCYTTLPRMQQAIDYWLWEYRRSGFVRWSIIDKCSGEAVGTVELFRRNAADYFTDCGLLRLDLRSDYEKYSEIRQILALIVPPAFSLFDCERIATKATPQAQERIAALLNMQFLASKETLIGHDGTTYGHYYVLPKQALST